MRPEILRSKRSGGLGRLAAAAVAILAVTCPGGAPGRALAQPLEESELEVLRRRFFEAIELEEKGEWEKARAIFKEIAPKRTSPQVRYHIALCDENLGRLADALRGYEEALELAIAEKSETAAPVIENAEKRLGPLRPRVPVLTVSRADDDRRAVRIDGRLYMPHQLKKPLLLDPGEHRVEVAASQGFEVFETFTLAEGEKRTLELSPKPPAKPVVSMPPTSAGPTGEQGPPTQGGDEEGGSRAPAIVVGVAGIAALAGGGVLFGLSQVAANDVKAGCPQWETGTCPTELEARAKDGALMHDLSFVVGGVGAAAVVTSVVLWVALGPDEPSTTPPVSVVPVPLTRVGARGTIELDGAAAVLEARF